jgi:predicted O-linked N-acetylglucosamine transferase (SPINDLY family)
LDSTRLRRIGEIFESWASPKAETRVAWPVKQVAHVVGSVSADHAAAHYVKLLAASLKLQGIESVVFSTEWAASWFIHPPNAQPSESLRMETDTRIASVDGDFSERAAGISAAIRGSGIPVAFYHAGLTEQITARVAALRPAPIQVNVSHGSEMDADLFEARIHLYQSALTRTRFPVQAEWIPPVSDIEDRLQLVQPVTRRSMGLESAGSVSATFGDLSKAAGSGYLRVLSEIMKRFPKHFHFFAGPGNVKAIRSYLHSENVLSRVRFLGNLSDVAPLVDSVDVYLASFPDSGPHFLLDAMGAGKPVVVLKHTPDSEGSAGAELVGLRELIAPGEADYIEIADGLLRSPALRRQRGEAMRLRFRHEFRPQRLGEKYQALIRQLCERT